VYKISVTSRQYRLYKARKHYTAISIINSESYEKNRGMCESYGTKSCNTKANQTTSGDLAKVTFID